jgi:importin-5
LMRAKALECASLVGLAVGKERFAADAHEIMKYMQAVQAAGLDPDDPLPGYMLQAGARICKTLGRDFLPYLPIVMPPMLEAARHKPDIKVAPADGSDDEVSGDDDEEALMETFVVGDKRVSLHTSVLEEKANACSMMCCYAYELKDGFFSYAEEVTAIMVPLLKFYFNEEVRISAAQTLPELLRSATMARDAGAGPTDDFVRGMLSFMWAPLMDCIAKEMDTDVVCAFVTSAEELLEVAQGPRLLPPDQLPPLFEALSTVLKDYEERRQGRQERAEGEDFDEEEAETLEQEHEAESELLDAVGDCMTRVLREYKDVAMPLVEGMMPAVARLLEKGRFPEERRVALCLMDDVIEHSPSGAAKYMSQVVPLLLAGCADRDERVRQCCAYGLGQAAEHRIEAFRPHVSLALQAVLAIVQAPDSRSEENETATDNAISSLGKLLEFHPEAVDPALGALWLSYLPITADEIEARVVHAQLLRLVQKSDPRVLGVGNANLQKLVEVMVRVLAKGDKLIDSENAGGMATLLRQMQAALPAEVFNGFVASLKPKQQATLQAVLSGQAVPAEAQ